MLTRRRVLLTAAFLAGALALWVGYDLTDWRRHDLREFDGHEVGRLETAMWRSYYEHHPTRLFVELTQLLRDQFHLPFWKSCAGAYRAARAAVTFQAGHSRVDYERALPDLRRYYALIREASTSDFDVQRTAALELEWWIIHRERAHHQPSDLYRSLAELQAEIYGLPAERFEEHARTRGEAMLLRDARAEDGSPSEADWQRIGALLDESWMSLRNVVGQTR
jgi:hypothetical protein